MSIAAHCPRYVTPEFKFSQRDNAFADVSELLDSAISCKLFKTALELLTQVFQETACAGDSKTA